MTGGSREVGAMEVKPRKPVMEEILGTKLEGSARCRLYIDRLFAVRAYPVKFVIFIHTPLVSTPNACLGHAKPRWDIFAVNTNQPTSRGLEYPPSIIA